MVYDFIFSRGSVDVQNNLAFIRANVDLDGNYAEFNYLQNCISRVLKKSNEDIPDVVRQLLVKISSYSGPVGNKTEYKIVSEYICSLRFYGFDVFLIRRPDIQELVPLDDGVTIGYLLDMSEGDISHIYTGLGKEFDEDVDNMANNVDAIMTWFVSGDLSLNSDLEQLCNIDAKRNDYSDLKARKMSIYYDASPVYQFLRENRYKPILVTNILPNEYEDGFLENEDINSGDSENVELGF